MVSKKEDTMGKKELSTKMLRNWRMARISIPSEEGYMVGVFISQNDQIQLTIEKAFNVVLPARYEVTFYDGIFGIQKCDCELREGISGSSGSDSVYAECQVLEILDIKQRRENVKVALEANIVVSINKGEEWFEATIKNISAGGVFFECDFWLEHERRVDFSLTTPDKTLPLTAKVVRIEKLKERSGYGCKFIELPNSIESALRNYVFDLQRKNAKL